MKLIILLRIVLLFLISGISSVYATNSEKMLILSTIKPVHLIVTAIAGDHAETLQLIPDYASPHNYSFKPNDIRKIKRARLIFRIDEHFEAILSPALEINTQKSQLVSLAEEKGIHLLSMSGGGHQHGSFNKEHHDDLHIWTSPENVLVMASIIATHLAEVDPQNAQSYRSNLKQFKMATSQVIARIKPRLLALKNEPYIVFHNSWQYFARYFDLRKPEVISLHEGLSGSIKSILDARQKIKAENIGCVLSDPNVKPSRVSVLMENLTIKTASIDVLATNVDVARNGYVDWLETMATSIERCLKSSE